MTDLPTYFDIHTAVYACGFLAVLIIAALDNK